MQEWNLKCFVSKDERVPPRWRFFFENVLASRRPDVRPLSAGAMIKDQRWRFLSGLKLLAFVEVHKIYEAKNNNDKEAEGRRSGELIEASHNFRSIPLLILLCPVVRLSHGRHFLSSHWRKIFENEFPYKLIKFVIKKSFRPRLAEVYVFCVCFPLTWSLSRPEPFPPHIPLARSLTHTHANPSSYSWLNKWSIL